MNLSPAALASAWASAASSVLNEVPSDRMPMSLSPWDLAQLTITWAYWALDGRVLNAVGFSLALNSAKAPSPLTCRSPRRNCRRSCRPPGPAPRPPQPRRAGTCGACKLYENAPCVGPFEVRFQECDTTLILLARHVGKYRRVVV